MKTYKVVRKFFDGRKDRQVGLVVATSQKKAEEIADETYGYCADATLLVSIWTAKQQRELDALLALARELCA